MRTERSVHAQPGFTILEVVIAIAVFAIGMLALASLQGALTRSMADSRVRTVAGNVAEQTIEHAKAFQQLVSGGGVQAFNDIVTATATQVADGIGFTVATNVTNYYYDPDTDSFSTTNSIGAATATFKEVAVTVSWDGSSRSFRGQSEGAELSSADLGTGSVTVTASIPALVTSASAKVADETEQGDQLAPPVSYTPGQNPDIIALSLDDNKFKESLTPEPEVIRDDSKVETTFDVVTYSNVNDSASFLRREEFTVVSCTCEMHGPDSDNPGRRPVIWAGDEYLRGQLVAKPYGVSADNNQSDLCDTCCRDHHDGGTSDDDSTDSGVNVYGPFKGSAEYVDGGDLDGDHKHYTADGDLAGVGDDYLEACRLVRVNGFYRVAQDFRQEDRYVFPADFLDEDSEVALYSDYVTGAVSAYQAATTDGYQSSPPCIGLTGTGCVDTPDMSGAWPASNTDATTGEPISFPSWTTLPFGADDSETEQLRSRGIYIDYLSQDLRAVIACLRGGSASVESCQQGDVVLDQTGSLNYLEVMPFYDVQLTYLNRWGEIPYNTPIDTTNEPVATGNTHSRGVISRNATAASAVVIAKGHRGNLGFTDTPAIDPLYDSYVASAEIEVQSLDADGNGGSTPSSSGIYVSGNLYETVSGNPNIVLTGLNGVSCNQTSADYECFIPDTPSGTPEIQVSGYGKSGKTRYACSVDMSETNYNADGTSAYAVFDASGLSDGGSYDITVQNSSCT